VCKKVYSDILPHFGVTSCLGARDILPLWGGDILPRRTRHPALATCATSCLFPLHLSDCLLAHQKPEGGQYR
jgi:hypothetical protein